MLALSIDKNAKAVFDIHIRGREMDCNGVKDIFWARFHSPSKQVEISRTLISLKLADFRKPEDSSREVLDKLVERITLLIPMARPEDDSEYNKVEFLKKAIREESFALAAFNKLGDRPDFDDAVTRIKMTLSDIDEVGNKPGVEKVEEPIKSSKGFIVAALHQQLNDGYRTQKRKCSNCEDENWSLAKCTKPLDVQKIARNLEDFKKSKPRSWQTRKVNLNLCAPRLYGVDDLN